MASAGSDNGLHGVTLGGGDGRAMGFLTHVQNSQEGREFSTQKTEEQNEWVRWRGIRTFSAIAIILV